MAKARRKKDRFLETATNDAIVRFGPEASGLMALLQEAQSERTQGIQSARSTARSITDAITTATPAVSQIYRQAGATQGQAAELVAGDLARLQGVNPTILAAAATERAGATDRLAGAQASALTDLQQQRVATQRGKQFQVQRANQDFSTAVAKVLQRRQDLAREQGAFIASTVGKERESARQRAADRNELNMRLSQQERNSIRSSGIDPNTGAPIPGGRLDPDSNGKPGNQKKDAPKKVGTSTQLNFGNTYQQAMENLRSQIDPDRAHGRAGGRTALLNGLEPVTKKVRNKDGLVETQVLAPKVDAVKNPLAARVALDMYYDGHLSPETVKMLRRNGIRVKALPGVTTNRKAPKPQRKGTTVLDDVAAALGR